MPRLWLSFGSIVEAGVIGQPVKQCSPGTPSRGTQCRNQSVHFKHDARTRAYETVCGRCGRRERHEPRCDDEGIYYGFTHDVW
jgi:hypothetical protein